MIAALHPEDLARGDRETHDAGELAALVWPLRAAHETRLDAERRGEVLELAGYLELDGKPGSPWQVNGSDEPGPLVIGWWDGAAWEGQVEDEVDEVLDCSLAGTPGELDGWACSPGQSAEQLAPMVGWRERRVVLIRFATE